MRTRHLLAVGAVALAGAVALSAAFLDRPAGAWAHGLDPAVRAFFAAITDLGLGKGWLIASILLWATALAGARLASDPARRQRWASWSWLPLFVFASIVTAGALSSILKFLFGRMRPKLYWADQSYGFTFLRTAADHSSLPSGHTVTMFALAGALTLIWRAPAPAWYLAALIIGLSRVIVGAHWPSDVLAGACVGTLGALATRAIFANYGVAPTEARRGMASWRRTSPWWAGLYRLHTRDRFSTVTEEGSGDGRGQA